MYLAHSIDIASMDTNLCLNTSAALARPNVDRGDSDLDVRHSFTAADSIRQPCFLLGMAA